MTESKFGYWHRQTLREKEANILKDWKSERSKLLDIIKIQGEALEFYANPNGSRTSGLITHTMYLDDMDTINDVGYILKMKGQRARQALAEVERIKIEK